MYTDESTCSESHAPKSICTLRNGKLMSSLKLCFFPQIPEPYALLGLIYQDSRKYERALVFYKLACTRDPKNLLNHQETARIAGIIGDHTSRLEALRIIARLNPCDLNVAIERARCLLELDKPKQVGKRNTAFEETVRPLLFALQARQATVRCTSHPWP